MNNHNSDEFHKERHYIAKINNCHNMDIDIEEHPAIGELCIYIHNRWTGYIDNEFYEKMWEWEEKNRE